MDDFSSMFNWAMERATTLLVYCMFAALIENTLEAERKQVRATLGHEPNPENWQDYYDLKRERTSRQNASQREADKKKLRRLVFGEEGQVETS